MKLADQRVRDRIRDDLDTTLIIEAAAGTGKTTALVDRLVAVLASGRAELARIAAVTFTEKAAGELKLRLRAAIESGRHDGALDAESRARLTASLPQLEEARIGTIHSFCADLLRERPVEAQVDPQFEVAPEDAARGLFEQAFGRWFEQALGSPGEGMRRLLRRRDFANREGPRGIARRAAEELVAWRDFDAPWRPAPLERERLIDELADEICALGELGRSYGGDDYLAASLIRIATPVIEATRLESVRGRDYDALEAVLFGLARGTHWNWRGYVAELAGVPREQVIARRDALRARILAFRDAAGASLAPLLREELRPVIDYYDELKRRAGKLDFLDLLLIARGLVRDHAGVRADLQRRFERVFIDEFQDTDPLQAEILVLLAADNPAEPDWLRVRPVPGKLFIVGDPKQSIYRFRRADVALYQTVKQRLTECGAAVEHLTVSFRATPALQEMVNAAFAPQMPADTATQAAYVPLAPFREEQPGQPPVVVLPVPQPYSDYGRVTGWSIESSLPDAIAAMIRWLVDQSGWTVTEREAPEQRVPIRPRHICVLFRRLTSFGRDVTRPYLRALEARHIAHVLVRGGSFKEREEIEALRNVLGAIDRPDDELLVFASLRGPFFALLDDQLLEFRERVGSLHPFRKLADGLCAHLSEVGEALGVLRELTRGRNRRPIADTIARLLAATRAHAGVVIRPTGEQALANIMRLANHARRYEARSGATSFRGFVEELEERAERDEPGEVPIVEEGTEGVRIMTVHRAKGLEFPVVVLADITCNETAEEPSRYVDPATRLCALRLAGCAPGELHDHAEEEKRRDVEEAVRVLYVAATRARDLLVVPAAGDQEWDGWVAKLHPALYPDDKNRRAPLTRQPDGCPEFGDDTSLTATRPPRAPAKFKAVAPGLHVPRAGNHRVVWWDPSRLILDVREAMGLRQLKLLQEDESHRVSDRGIRMHEQWRALRDATIERASAPMMKVATATEMAAAAPDAEGALGAAIRIEEVSRDPSRPHGARFGTLVHWTLLRTPFGADRARIEQIVRSMARMLAATGEEIAAAVAAVANALGSPLLARAASAAECRRECSLLAILDDGTILEGIADLAFQERNGGAAHWTVVDFKTDLDLAPRLAEYRAQVALYVRALGQATGAPTDGTLLWI